MSSPTLEKPSVTVFYSRDSGVQLRIEGQIGGLEVSLPLQQAALFLSRDVLLALVQEAKEAIPAALLNMEIPS